MNIFKERRQLKAVCPRCKHPDYTMHPPVTGETIKPEFRCKACGNIWSYGYDGGVYAELAMGYRNVIKASRPASSGERAVLLSVIRGKCDKGQKIELRQKWNRRVGS